MKLKPFTLGAVAGVTSLVLAVPIIAQVSLAATSSAMDGVTAMAGKRTRPAPTQQDVTDMAARAGSFLANIDAFVTVQKSVTQSLQSALTAAASITDDAQRQAAVQKAHEDMRAAIEAAVTAHPDLKLAMMPLGHKGPGHQGKMGRGPNPGMLAEKLGMTVDELKAALESGKTIEQIATEKGITLPARPMKGGRFGGPMGFGPMNNQGATSSAQ